MALRLILWLLLLSAEYCWQAKRRVVERAVSTFWRTFCCQKALWGERSVQRSLPFDYTSATLSFLSASFPHGFHSSVELSSHLLHHKTLQSQLIKGQRCKVHKSEENEYEKRSSSTPMLALARQENQIYRDFHPLIESRLNREPIIYDEQQ